MKILKDKSEIEFKEKGSKFIGIIEKINSREEAEQKIKEYWKLHSKATHICTAYRYDLKDIKSFFDDNGEPSMTAGAPILQVIEGNDLVNVLILVIRYFGGTLLGKGGLIRAYSKAARDVIEASSFLEVYEKNETVIDLNYDEYNLITYWMRTNNVVSYNEDFQETIRLNLFLDDNELNSLKEYYEIQKKYPLQYKNLGNVLATKNRGKWDKI